MKEKFSIEFLVEAVEFLNSLEPKAKEKIYYNIRKSQFVSDSKLFKKLNDTIWEFRTLYNKNYYRLFAFWVRETGGKETLVIATHGILKKSQKTPKKEIEKAENLRNLYLNQINKDNEK